jgi:hypothetical protein
MDTLHLYYFGQSLLLEGNLQVLKLIPAKTKKTMNEERVHYRSHSFCYHTFRDKKRQEKEIKYSV